MFSEKEEEEIINEFLKVIEMNDLKVNITTKVGECVNVNSTNQIWICIKCFHQKLLNIFAS